MIAIRHDVPGGRFSASVDGREAYLLYRPAGPGTVDIATTFVPPPLRERGIGSELARHALDYARGQGLRVVPSCWFVRRFMERHPEYEDLVVGGGDR